MDTRYINKFGIYQFLRCITTTTSIQQHQKSIVDKKWDLTGISFHVKTCRFGFNWEETTLLKTEEKKI